MNAPRKQAQGEIPDDKTSSLSKRDVIKQSDDLILCFNKREKKDKMVLMPNVFTFV